MKRISLILLLSLYLLTACSSIPSQATTQPGAVAPTSALTALPLQTSTPAPERAPTTPPSRATNDVPTATRVAAINVTQTAPISKEAPTYTELALGAAIVRINATDLQVLSQADFTLSGQASEGTVVSVNDDFVVTGTDQKFAFLLKLQEGPNLIEIEASNAQGQDNSLGLVLIYDPSP